MLVACEPGATSPSTPSREAHADAAAAPVASAGELAASSSVTSSASPSAVAPFARTGSAAPAPSGFVPIPAKHPQAFSPKRFAEVRAFAFDLQVRERPVCKGPLNSDGALCSTVVVPGARLSSVQAERLLGLLRSPKTYGSDLSGCFLPHHGFVFYDGAGVPLAEVAVCFLCDNLRARPAIPGVKQLDGSYALTTEAVTELRGLCNELGMPGCNAKRPEDFGPPPSP